MPRSSHKQAPVAAPLPKVHLFHLRGDALVLALRGIGLQDVSNVRATCKKIERIPLEAFLPSVFENSFVGLRRQSILKEKFCSWRVAWPVRVLHLLLKADGVDADHRDPDGRTLLWFAAVCGRADTVKALLSSGAACDIGDCAGFLPLHAAADTGQTDTIDALIQFGADVNVATYEGVTLFFRT